MTGMIGSDLRIRRVTARVPGRLLSSRAGIDRAKYSAIECGHLEPRDDELARIETALTELSEQRRKVKEFADRVGWPMG